MIANSYVGKNIVNMAWGGRKDWKNNEARRWKALIYLSLKFIL